MTLEKPPFGFLETNDEEDTNEKGQLAIRKIEHTKRYTFPMARRPRSKKVRMPKNVNRAPKAVRKPPISSN